MQWHILNNSCAIQVIITEKRAANVTYINLCRHKKVTYICIVT